MLTNLSIFLPTIVVMEVASSVIVPLLRLAWLYNTVWHCSYITKYLSHLLTQAGQLGLFSLLELGTVILRCHYKIIRNEGPFYPSRSNNLTQSNDFRKKLL